LNQFKEELIQYITDVSNFVKKAWNKSENTEEDNHAGSQLYFLYFAQIQADWIQLDMSDI
jgi:hypothetical protein